MYQQLLFSLSLEGQTPFCVDSQSLLERIRCTQSLSAEVCLEMAVKRFTTVKIQNQ